MIRVPTLRYENPVLTKELRSRMRGGRAFWVMFLYLGVIGLVFVICYASWAYITTNQTSASGLGRNLFSAATIVQLILAGVIVPSLTSGMITLEKEQKTYELLAATGLSPRNIVLGKLFSALIFVVLLVLTTIPFTSVSFFFGGVSPFEVLAVYALLLSISFLAASIGIVFSAIVNRTSGAVMSSYGVVILLGILGSASVAWMTTRSMGVMNQSPNAGNWLLGPLLYGRGSAYGVTVPIWAFVCAYVILVGILLLIFAIERMEHYREDKSLAKRIVSSILYVYSLALIFGFVLGFQQAGNVGMGRGFLNGLYTALFAIIVLMAPMFLSGEFVEKWRGSLIPYLVSGFSPRHWLRGVLRAGMPFLLLWVIVGATLLRFSFMWSKVTVAPRSWSLFWVDSILLVAFLFGMWGIGVFLSAVTNQRSRALAIAYLTAALLVVLPLLPLIWSDIPSVRPLQNLLYINPFFPLWTQIDFASMRMADSLRFAPMAPWKVTSIVYGLIGIFGLAFATPLAAGIFPRPDEDAHPTPSAPPMVEPEPNPQ